VTSVHFPRAVPDDIADARLVDAYAALAAVGPDGPVLNEAIARVVLDRSKHEFVNGWWCRGGNRTSRSTASTSPEPHRRCVLWSIDFRGPRDAALPYLSEGTFCWRPHDVHRLHIAPFRDQEDLIMASELKAATVTSLGAKLDKLQAELTPEEAAVLAGLLGVAGSTLEKAHVEVPSAGHVDEVITPAAGVVPKMSDLLDITFKPGGVRAEIFNPGDEVSDSIGVGVACVSWSKDYNIEAIERLDRVRVPDLSLKVPGLKATRRIGG
jgi:hypothetical protein